MSDGSLLDACAEAKTEANAAADATSSFLMVSPPKGVVAIPRAATVPGC